MRTAARIVGMATVAAAAKPSSKVYVVKQGVPGATDGVSMIDGNAGGESN